MPSPVALFVSEQALKSFTSINQNVSPADLTPFILQAQDIELQYYLGSTFYFSIQDQVLTNTVSVANQFLLDQYISKALCNYALERALPFIKYKMFNKSVLSPNSENADTITLEELKFLQQEVRSTAEVYMKRLVEWIINHPEDYPVYFASVVTDGQLPSNETTFYNSLTIPAQPYAWKKRARLGPGTANPSECLECLTPNNSNFQQTQF